MNMQKQHNGLWCCLIKSFEHVHLFMLAEKIFRVMLSVVYFYADWAFCSGKCALFWCFIPVPCVENSLLKMSCTLHPGFLIFCLVLNIVYSLMDSIWHWDPHGGMTVQSCCLLRLYLSVYSIHSLFYLTVILRVYNLDTNSRLSKSLVFVSVSK